MVQPFNYRIQPVDVGNYFDAFTQARQSRRVQEADDRSAAARKYLPDAYAGNADAQAQLMTNDPELGMRVDQARLQKARDEQNQIGSLLVAVQSGKMSLDQAKATAVTQFGFDPAKVQGITEADIPALIARSADAQKQLDAMWERDYKERSFKLDKSRTAAQNAASYASAEAQRASAAKDRASLTPTIGPDGKPVGPMPKLTEGQSKDLGFYRRGSEANRRLTPDRIAAMTSTKDTGARNVPLIGNALQSAASRQGGQAALDFLATVLRKDTGAAVTEQEFDFYGRIFIPQWGDDAVTIRQKEQARAQALESIKLGLGPAQILTQMGYQAPPEGQSAAPAGGSVIRYDGQGRRVQ